MVKIDFFIVGQPKSGTTALADFLSQHHQVCMSIPKEPVVFATDHIKESDKFHGENAYFPFRKCADLDRLFSHCSKVSNLLGEASTSYLYSKEAPQNIFNHNKNAKIIMMLRDPVEMIYALHSQYVNETQETIADFEEALNIEPDRKRGKGIPKRITVPSYLYYKDRTHYVSQIKRYIRLFPPSQIKILINEEFRQNNPKFFKEVCEFLHISTSANVVFSQIHTSKSPRSVFINKFINAPTLKNTVRGFTSPKTYNFISIAARGITMKNQQRIMMRQDLKNQLKNELRDEVVSLSRLIDKDLISIWGY